MPLILILLVVPLIELLVLIEVGGEIGAWPTIGLVVLTAVAGGLAMRQQGMRTLRRAEAALAAGRPPVREVFDGLCILAGGGLLLLPGFITDAIGILLIVPGIRHGLGRALWRAIAGRGEVRAWAARRTAHEGVVIDTDFEEIDPRTGRPRAPGDDQPTLPPRRPPGE